MLSTAAIFDCHLQPLTTTVSHLQSTAGHHPPPPLATSLLPSAIVHHCRWPRSMVFLEIYTIFPGMLVSTKQKNCKIPTKSICIPKMSYPRKLSPKIAFLGIAFLAMNIHSAYQTLLKVCLVRV